MQCVVSVRDKRAMLCGGLYLAPNLAVAARIFSDAITQGEMTVIRQHPEDYVLVHVGDFDEDTGLLIPFELGETSDCFSVVIEAEAVMRNLRPAVLTREDLEPVSGRGA